jgi:Na+/phosphate symporter
MIANALLLSIALFLAYGFWLLGQLKFMAAYKAVLLHAYGNTIFACAGVLFLNIFAAAFALQRRFFLKDTGRKLSHLDKQFQTGQIQMPVPAENQAKE